MAQSGLRLIVSGGGTGGHLFPGIAVAEAFLAKAPESKVLFIGTQRHTDMRVLAGRNFETASIACQGLKGKSVRSRIQSLFRLPLSLMAAGRLVRQFKPDLVLGVGGYVTGPVLLAARLMGVATCIQEQNSVPGLANRIIGKFVHRVFISFPKSEKYFPAGKCMLTGTPVRQKLLSLAQEQNEPESYSKKLLVLGGSLGAHKVNMVVADALKEAMKQLPVTFKVLHQTGKDDEQLVKTVYASLGLEAEVSAFFDDMTRLYKEADVVISRAGATSLAEMTVLGKPMILIPYPYAADDHQRKNGEYLVEGGAARMFLQEDLEPGKLAKEILLLLASKEKRKEMSEAARKLAMPDAVDVIVRQMLAMVSGQHDVN